MGRRSRTRAAASGAPRPERPKPARTAPKKRDSALGGLPPARKVLAIYVGVSALLAVLVLVGTIVLVGTLGPFIVLAYALVGAGLTFRWAQGRLRDLPMTDEDRVLQTMAGGLLAMTVFLAVLFAIVLTVA